MSEPLHCVTRLHYITPDKPRRWRDKERDRGRDSGRGASHRYALLPLHGQLTTDH